MKALFKLFLGLALVIAMAPVSAQVLQRQVTTGNGKDSVAAAGTKYFTFTYTQTGLEGINFTGIKAASGGGTLNSYVILQVRTDTMPTASTSVWEDYINPYRGTRDTLFITDGTTPFGHQFPIPLQYFNGIRAKVVSTGAQKFYVYYSQLRR